MSISGTLFGNDTGADARDTQDAVALLLDRLMEWQARCTCEPGSDIRLCPNYLPDDELDFNGDDMRIKRGKDWIDAGPKQLPALGIDGVEDWSWLKGEPASIEEMREQEDQEEDDDDET